MNNITKVLIIGICICAFSTNSFGQNMYNLVKGVVYTLPIAINETMAIEGVDIFIEFDPSKIKPVNTCLEVGVLVSNDPLIDYELTDHIVNSNYYNIRIKAKGNIQEVNQGETFAFFSFIVTGNVDQSTQLFFDQFICNSKENSGGFMTCDKNYQESIQITIQKASLANVIDILKHISNHSSCLLDLKTAIQSLKILSGFKNQPQKRSILTKQSPLLKNAEINILELDNLSIPVKIAYTEFIEGIDITFQYDSSIVQLEPFSLTEGILSDKKYSMEYNDDGNQVKISIFARNILHSAEGILFSLNSRIIKSDSTFQPIIFKEFTINMTSVLGNTQYGFEYDDDIVQRMDLYIPQKTTSINGIVYNDDNLPLELAQVSIWSESTQNGQVCFSDQNGNFSFNELQAATDYLLNIIPESNSNLIPLEKIELIGNQNTMKISLSKGFLFSGILKDIDLQPLQNIRIKLISSKKKVNKETITNTSGNYSFSGTPASDDYIIQTFSPDDLNLKNTIIINQSINQDIRKNIILYPGQIMNGFVYDSNQQPFINANVKISSNNLAFERTVKTDESGFFECQNLSITEEYQLSAFFGGYVTESKRFNVQDSPIQLYLFSAGSINGSVKTSDENPLQNAVIKIDSEMASFESTYLSDENGEFHINDLKLKDSEKNDISDYCITVFAKGYLPKTKSNVRIGESVQFLFSGNYLSGVLKDTNNMTPSENISNKIFLFNRLSNNKPDMMVADKDGFFKLSGLDNSVPYQFLFCSYQENKQVQQWAGNNDMGIALDNRENAKDYFTSDHILFQLNSNW